MSTHKRTSSAAGNTNAGPEVKRQTPMSSGQNHSHPESRHPEPQYVYIVMIDSAPQYMESTSDIHGVYATIKDANNAVKAIVNNFGEPEECTHGFEDDGRLHWESGDAGEGERIEVRIKVEEVKGPGSEPEREMGPNFGILEDASEEEDGEDGNSDEDNEE
jgi:hypothetical protein